jgi:hypothetical protein
MCPRGSLSSRFAAHGVRRDAQPGSTQAQVKAALLTLFRSHLFINLDDGVRLRSEGSSFRASLPISLEILIRLFDMHSLRIILPFPPSSFRLEAVVERFYPTRYKCLFLPLLDNLLNFPPSHFQLASISAFLLLAARSTIFRELFTIFYPLSESL